MNATNKGRLVATFLVFGTLIFSLIGYAMFFKPSVEHPVNTAAWAVSVCPDHINGVCLRR